MNRYIIYLNPHKSNPILEKWGELKERIRRDFGEEQYSSNIAFTYPAHMTLTGFFSVEERELEQVKEYLETEVPSQLMPVHEPVVTYDGLLDQGNVLLKYKESVAFDQFLDGLDDYFDFLSRKKRLHMSLAYGPKLEEFGLSRYTELVKDVFSEQVFEDPNASNWNVTLWKTESNLTNWEPLEIWDLTPTRAEC
eukprot:gb/GECG01006131.1/.p1 GENE.gb/GECG01006131.1/~~gb/GECG01006131.1/.p1  ORF type:complete len:194 (+),score=26.63 gb/GECG01006131.1/:1-582(+)